jgi:transposase-like protein
MAQLNLILNQDEILQLLRDNRDEAFTKLLQESLNRVLLAESEEQLKAKPYERTDDRTDSRNGTRERSLITRIGTIELAVPRHRNIPFHTLIFDNYQRSEAALILTMAEMVVAGVSTKKVSDVMETLCGTTFSKSTVSEACKDLDESVKDFRERKFAKDYLFVMVDATYLKVREGGSSHRFQGTDDCDRIHGRGTQRDHRVRYL